MASSADLKLLSAYAHSLGMRIDDHDEAGMPVVAIDFSEDLEGRPGALHGGATSGILETAGYAALRTELSKQGRNARLKPINVTVQFLRAGLRKRTLAAGRIKRLGRRNANIVVEAWQDDREKPIATAVMNVMVVEAD